MMAGRQSAFAQLQDFVSMCDTVKIKRPLFCRRREDLGGRIREDSPGTVVKVKTRAHDSGEDSSDSLLELTDKWERGSEG